MIIIPVTFRRACEFVLALHRHNKPPRGHKFSIGLEKNGTLVGVAMAGRPIARHFDDGLTLEINRTCTDGSRNANSMLYGAVRRAAWGMGYKRIITYTQCEELPAMSWTKGGNNCPHSFHPCHGYLCLPGHNNRVRDGDIPGCVSGWSDRCCHNHFAQPGHTRIKY